jgi:hypothetical protein
MRTPPRAQVVYGPIHPFDRHRGKLTAYCQHRESGK